MGALQPTGKAGVAVDEQQTGHFGRYSVVVVPVGSPGKVTEWRTILDTQSVGFLERVVSWFTGHLNREKNAALIDLIRSGNAHVKTAEGNVTHINIECRLQAFKNIIAGATKATYEEKLEACEAMRSCINEAKGFWKQELHVRRCIGDKAVDDQLNTFAQVLISTFGSLGQERATKYATGLLESASKEQRIVLVDLARGLQKKILEQEGPSELVTLVGNIALKASSNPEFYNPSLPEKSAIPDDRRSSADRIQEALSESLKAHRKVYTSFFQTERFNEEREGLSRAIFALMV